MELIGGAILLLLNGYIIYLVKRRPAGAPAIEAPKDEHILVSTWIEGSTAVLAAGWRWECSCGVEGTCGDHQKYKTVGTEQNAVDRFKEHAQAYREANGNRWRDLLAAKEAELDAFRKNCYCKDIH
jgi:hypothetical protein